jgi:hypothetical protein
MFLKLLINDTLSIAHKYSEAKIFQTLVNTQLEGLEDPTFGALQLEEVQHPSRQQHDTVRPAP